MGERGYVYIMHNCSFPEVKIGMTTRTPEVRAKELSSTSVPRPFVPLFSVEVDDAGAVEARLHDRFGHFRVDRHREFFWLSPHIAIKALLEEAGVLPPSEASEGSTVDITDLLMAAYGSLLDENLSRALIEHTDDQTTLVCHIRRDRRMDVVHRDISYVLPAETTTGLFTQGSGNESAIALLQENAYDIAMATPIFSLDGKQLLLDVHEIRDRDPVGASEYLLVRGIRKKLAIGASIEKVRELFNVPKTSIDSVGVHELPGGLFVLVNRARAVLRELNIEAIDPEDLSLEEPRSYAVIIETYVDSLDVQGAIIIGHRHSDRANLPWLRYEPEIADAEIDVAVIGVSGRTNDGRLFSRTFRFATYVPTS